MAINLSDKDHDKLDELLGQVLEWHNAGDVTKSAAIGAIAHIIAAAAQDNEGEVQSWLHNPGVLNRWKDDIGNA